MFLLPRLKALLVLAWLVAPSLAASGATPSTDAAILRPAYNTGTGFFVVGRKLYDANGQEFRIRGTNDIGFWRGGIDRALQRKSMKAMRVNAVRLVFANKNGDGPHGTDTPAYRDSVVQAFVDEQIVPIPAVWWSRAGLELTCTESPDTLASAIDDWVDADLGWVKARERYIIVNLANEWGPQDSPVWRDAYIAAVKRMRAAGINATLMIDAGRCGQDRLGIIHYGQAILDADPQKNLIFSVHVYGAYWSSATMAADFAELAATGLCVTVGEFSSQAVNQAEKGWHAITPEEVIAHAESQGIGWLAWQWYNDSAENIVTGPDHSPQLYPPPANLTPFGTVVKNNLVRAQPATVFP